MNRFTSPWIVSHMNRLFLVWIVSQNSLTCTKSIHLIVESFILHPGLTWIDSLMHWIASSFMCSWVVFCCLNRFTHLVNRFTLLILCENFVLSLLFIYSLLFITLKILNHLQLFSLGLKNSLHIYSSRLNTFFRITLYFESHWFSRVLVGIVSWFFKEDWLGLIKASKWRE